MDASMAEIRLDHRKVAAARVFASSHYPYLASALFAARVHPAAASGTIAVDEGWQVHADPTVVDAMSTDGSWSTWSLTFCATTPREQREPASTRLTAILKPGTGPATQR
jgi:hypothetical protein